MGGVDLGRVARTQTNLLGSLARGCGFDIAQGLGIKALLESDQLAKGLSLINWGTSGMLFNVSNFDFFIICQMGIIIVPAFYDCWEH